MRKIFTTIATIIIAATMAQAQLKVNSTGDVVLPGTVTASQGHLYFPTNKSVRFGSDADGISNAKWSMQYWNNGLNFWKPTGSTNAGDYKLFLSDNGNVGIGTGNPLYTIDMFGPSVRLINNSALFFYMNNADPRICAANRVVFYKYDNTGYIPIVAKNISESSDSTKKKNIKHLEKSLKKVLKLNGYNYNWKDDVENKEKQSGLIAQEVENIIPEVVTTTDSSMGKVISYTHIIPYLIEAIKEQQEQIAKNDSIENSKDDKINKQQKQISDLQSSSKQNIKTIADLSTQISSIYTQIENLNNQLTSLQNCCKSSGSKTKSYVETDNTDATIATNQTTKPVLYQNSPNPFKQSTTIKIELPQTIGSALVCIYDLTGRQLKCFTVTERGNTSVQINASQLSAGMYHYALIADGNLIDTKTMVLTE